MDYGVIACITIVVLLVAAILIFVKRDAINGRFDRSVDDSEQSDTLTGGAKGNNKRKTNKRSNKRSNNKGTDKRSSKTTTKRIGSYPKRKPALTNVHHNENARYVFIYFGDIYPDGLKESNAFKSVMNQTSFKNEAYGVYERQSNGQWVDNLLFDDAWEDFETRVASTFKQELMNGARLVLIGKGFGAFYSKIFKHKLGSVSMNFHRAIALNGMHLRELVPAMIMEKTGLTEINIMDIDFKKTECLFQGKDYVKALGLCVYVYILMFICDRINNSDYYSFYGDSGTSSVEIEPFSDIYENTYLAKYGGKFKASEWLKRPKLLEAVIKEAI